MVFINSQKFACESCIKGHRSSSCAHTDRPLFEIKKKGRPVSQCERCRELRSTKRVHSKCTCSDGKTIKGREMEKAIGTKQKRYIPIVPALPNGLKDAFSNSSIPTHPSNPRQKVDSLLNPCPCADVWNCQCRASTSRTLLQDAQGGESSGLAALAKAAAMYELVDAPSQVSPTNSARDSSPISGKAGPSSTRTPPSKHNRPPTPPHTHRHLKHSKTKPRTPSPGPDLPPLLFSSRPSDLPGTVAFAAPSLPPTLKPPPAFPGPMPPFSAITSLAGSGCTCGLRCSCPDCTEHRPPSSSRRDCGDGCGDCVDEGLATIDLAGVGCGFRWVGAASGSGPRSDALERFFAHAARVPPPGGPVALPKLCCGGSCGCGNACGCGNGCDGCCAAGNDNDAGDAGRAEEEESVGSSGEARKVVEEQRVSACCC